MYTEVEAFVNLRCSAVVLLFALEPVGVAVYFTTPPSSLLVLCRFTILTLLLTPDEGLAWLPFCFFTEKVDFI